MSNDEQLIRDLIHRWADAVHSGDLATVVAHHSDDVVMFDVPPPHEGVRGLDAYTRVWPGFFTWQASGATFDLLELEVTAGTDVAFAVALLRCGTPDDDPDARLRLTFGLRKVAGSWVITHEHHSFPHSSEDDGKTGKQEIRELHERWFTASAQRDLDATMAVISPSITSYEHSVPLQFTDIEAIREECRTGFEQARGDFDWSVPDLQIIVRGDIAVAWGLNRMADTVNGVETVMWSRGTRVFQRTGGTWLMIHQHVSFPYDPETGHAALNLTP